MTGTMVRILNTFWLSNCLLPRAIQQTADALTRRLCDLPEGGDERLNDTEQVVFKLQNLPIQLWLLADDQPSQDQPFLFDHFHQAYLVDPLSGKLVEAIRMKNSLKEITVAECTEQDRQVQYRGKWCVPGCDQLRLHLIQDDHDTALDGHPGWAKMFDLLDGQYYFKDMQRQVDQYVRNCHDCQRSRTSRHSTFGVLRPLPVPEKSWENISMDFVVGLPECEGFEAIWIVVDRLSKMWHFIPCHITIDALGLAVMFWWEVVHLHGLPLTIISDQGLWFLSTFLAQICDHLGIDRRM